MWSIPNEMRLLELYRPGGRQSMSRKRTSSKNRKGIRPMTPRAVERAALADPDALPLTAADLKRMKRTPRIKIIRRALGLTQGEFAARYHIPLGTDRKSTRLNSSHVA